MGDESREPLASARLSPVVAPTAIRVVSVSSVSRHVVMAMHASLELHTKDAEHALQPFPADTLVARLLPALHLLLLEVQPRGKVSLRHVRRDAGANEDLRQ